MTQTRKNGVILGGCLAFKTPVGLSFSAMKGLTKRLALVGQMNLSCEHDLDVPVGESIDKNFYFYHIRKGGQEKKFVIGELREMRLRPSSLSEATSLAHVGFPKLHAAVACIDPEAMIFGDVVQMVCLASTMVTDDQRFHPVLKCRSDREMWVDGCMCGENLILDGLVPVTDYRFDCWKPA
ncbi:MAG: hypothetical protein WCP24_00100 [bacterium]